MLAKDKSCRVRSSCPFATMCQGASRKYFLRADSLYFFVAPLKSVCPFLPDVGKLYSERSNLICVMFRYAISLRILYKI